jgi:hypothetical protein
MTGEWDDLLTNSIAVTPRTEATEPAGGLTRVPGTTITVLPCSIQKPSSSRVLAFSKEGVTIDRVIYYSTPQGIEVGCQIVPTGSSTLYYAIGNEYDASAGNGEMWAVDVEERT